MKSKVIITHTRMEQRLGTIGRRKPLKTYTKQHTLKQTEQTNTHTHRHIIHV